MNKIMVRLMVTLKDPNIVVNFWESYGAAFYFASGPVFPLAILVLLWKFIEELIPHVRDVIKDRIKSVQPSPHVPSPSCYLWPFHQSEGERNFLNRGVKAGYILIESKVSFHFFNEVISKEAVSWEDLWQSSHRFDISRLYDGLLTSLGWGYWHGRCWCSGWIATRTSRSSYGWSSTQGSSAW